MVKKERAAAAKDCGDQERDRLIHQCIMKSYGQIIVRRVYATVVAFVEDDFGRIVEQVSLNVAQQSHLAVRANAKERAPLKQQ